MEIRVGGSPVDFVRPQHRDLLVLLLLHANRVLGVDRLVEDMWGAAPPSTASAQLSNMVSAVRKTLTHDGRPAAELRRQHGGYLLRVDGDSVDLSAFDALVAQAGAASSPEAKGGLLRTAVGLWQGSPLVGIHAAYVLAARENLNERRAVAMEELFEAELRMGRHARLVPELTEEFAAHPFRERLLSLLMVALYRSGRQADALRVYRNAREALVEEHGLEPGAGLRALELRVLRGDPTLDDALPGDPVPSSVALNRPNGARLTGACSSAAPAMLPRGPAGFVGRAPEVAALVRLLLDRTDSPVVVSGMAGIGKTALALHACHALADRFPDGQLFVNLRGFDPRRPPVTTREALGQLLTALGVPENQQPTSVEARAGAFTSMLAGTRTLLLIDDAASSDQVRQLLPGEAACAVVVTSRYRLDGLVARDGASVVALGALPETGSRLLLRKLLGEERAAAEPEACTQLAALCGHLPLALRIAAARLGVAPAQPIAALVRLLANRPRLSELRVEGDDASVRAVFDASFGALPAPAARLLLLLGLHADTTVTTHAAAAICDIDPATARRHLTALADAHLVAEVDEDLYALHDLVYEYARARVTADLPAGERDEAIHRLLDFYLATALTADSIV